MCHVARVLVVVLFLASITLEAKQVAAQAQVPANPPKTIEDALCEKVSLDIVDTPLAEVAQFLTHRSGVPVRLDKTHLADCGFGPETAASLAVKNTSLRSALNLLCESLGNGTAWTVRNEAITLTSIVDADSNLQLKVYNVRDLVVFDNDPNGLADYDTLVDAITGTVAPSWDDVGGPASIKRCDLNGVHALVVSQTPEIHGQIDSLLAELRKLKAKPSP